MKAQSTMRSFLYTWNPKAWDWLDYQEAIYYVNNEGFYDMNWSSGARKNVDVGDTFFLMRLGLEPKGIIGYGYISSLSFLTKHWDKEKAGAGKVTNMTSVIFKALSEKPIFSLTSLQHRHPHYKWTPESGGNIVPQEIATDLLSLLQSDNNFAFEPLSLSEIKQYTEGRPRTLTIKNYDRNNEARRACIRQYGSTCTVCGFNYGKFYGSIGEGFIEVHHLKPISESTGEYSIDPIRDLSAC